MKTLLVTLFLLILLPDIYPQIGGYALQFDWIDDYVSANHTGITGDITLEAWIYPNYLSYYPGIITQRNTSVGMDWQLFYNGTMHRVEFWFGSGGGNVIFENLSGTGLTDYRWTHIAVTRSGSTWSLYIDGVLKGTEVNGTALTSDDNLRIGKLSGDSAPSSGELFWGKIDEVRIWNIARTEAQIKANMFRELAGNETGLVVYYKMSNGSGTTLTDNKTGGTNTGSISGATWKASGCFAGPRQALAFAGSDDYIDFGWTNSPAYNNSSLTIEAWINSTSSATDEVIVCWGSNFGLDDNVQFRMHERKLQLGIDVSGWQSVMGKSFINTGNWVHVAMVKNNSSVSLYVNGILDATGEINLNPNVPNFFIGAAYKNGSIIYDHYFPGKIDEVRVWNVARTESQIHESMMTTLAGNESNLSAYYRFDNYDGTTLYDVSGNAKNGTLTNMVPATAWVSSSAFNTWIGSESSIWSIAANWSLGSKPSPADNVGLYKWDLGSETSLSELVQANNLLFSSTASPTISCDFLIDGSLILGKDINISSRRIYLQTSGYLVEGNYRLYVPSGAWGTITATRTLGILNSENFAGLGAILSSQGPTVTVTVSGAGTAAVNGTYTFLDVFNGKNRYEMGDYKIKYETSPPGYWGIYRRVSDYFESMYYYTYDLGTNNNPPTTGWTKYEGDLPIPVVTLNTFNSMGTTTITRVHIQQGGSSILRYYDITPTTNTDLNATLAFKYDPNEIGSIPESDLRLFKSTDEGISYTYVGGIVNTNDNTVTQTGINSFSRWTLGDVNRPLPVELSSLTARVSGTCVILNWQTSTEVNNFGFEIERSLSSHSSSLNGHSLPAEWEMIGFAAGSGNSNSPKDYSFADDFNHSAIQSFNHSIRYRLKQIDNDGKFTYSEEIEVELLRPSQFELSQNYPNPFNPTTRIEFSIPSDNYVEIKVFNVLGMEVATLLNEHRQAGIHNIEFNASNFSSGIYFYKIVSGNNSEIKKMILLK
ncbi:MAG: LamG-like jellyroll fold domain-containing protein [Ignavibacteriaceae bacterium]